jgi:hypothetical protein
LEIFWAVLGRAALDRKKIRNLKNHTIIHIFFIMMEVFQMEVVLEE